MDSKLKGFLILSQDIMDINVKLQNDNFWLIQNGHQTFTFTVPFKKVDWDRFFYFQFHFQNLVLLCVHNVLFQ